MIYRLLLLALASLACLGCGRTPTPLLDAREVQTAPVELASQFDEAKSGTLKGRIRWEGPLPKIEPFIHVLPGPEGKLITKPFSNPNAPRITSTNTVSDTLIFLKSVDPHRSKPWSHQSVRLHAEDHQFKVLQGDSSSRIGFVRKGDSISLDSKQNVFHAIRARGASFFTLMFPRPDEPIQRQLDQNGLVEISSGAGFYWMRAYLMVSDHPYHATTNSQGQFELKDIPEGEYELVCWHPNYRVEKIERDPETGILVRQWYREPPELKQRVQVRAKQTTEVSFSMNSKSFE